MRGTAPQGYDASDIYRGSTVGTNQFLDVIETVVAANNDSEVVFPLDPALNDFEISFVGVYGGGGDLQLSFLDASEAVVQSAHYHRSKIYTSSDTSTIDKGSNVSYLPLATLASTSAAALRSFPSLTEGGISRVIS